ncbi:MAG TPA: T9SS type A sorting domain-containing protein [Bacteroides sp.]|nr:T9SS type A sorting domain-containing protein [Bacteroides sp.]
MFKKVLLPVLLVAWISSMQAQQIAIPRIDLMPDLPQPYLMRDWKQVARGYDSLVFNENMTGPYLPVVFLRESGVNYPDHASFGLHTAIGTVNPDAGEGINVIPAVIGASLVGIDKSDQFGHNWALMCEDFFNKRPEENIYLNHPVTSSGDDWWYETMPNVFFLQLNYLYPHQGEFDYQLETLANQMLTAVQYMGGSATPWQVPCMNYRAWSMSTMTPLEAGVKEPEAAGAIAWILYNAYMVTGDRKYLTGAEWSLEYLNSYPGNPSYELQLPYGVYTAARMNAEMDTHYDIQKMVNWCFDRGELRGWGAIVGKWGDYDCSGLIGEANDEGFDYAFAMNGFEQAGALVPMVRYDDRFATAIGKWVLNMSNASRLFYPNYLPDAMQDNENWAHNFDPGSYIAYESMKQSKYGKSPYATGDAMDGGWAATNLMLYSSSHVGILGGLIEQTNMEGILQLDLLKTDYYRNDSYPTYLYYNPYGTDQSVGVKLPAGSYDLYDAMSNAVIQSGVSESTNISIPAKQTIMLVHIPAGTPITTRGKKTFAGNIPIDYNNGTAVSDYPPRIQALAAEDTVMEVSTSIKVYCTAYDFEQEILKYAWTIEGLTIDSSDVFQFSPAATGKYRLTCKVSDPGNQWDTLSVTVEVVEKVKHPPVILEIEANTRKVSLSGSIELHCVAEDENNDTLHFQWTSSSGSIVTDRNTAIFTAPDTKSNCFIACRVTDTDGMSDTDSIEVMVRDLSVTPTGNLIAHYPMNGNAQDASGNDLHGIPGGVTWVADQKGLAGSAVHFNGNDNYIRVTNNDLLNFQEAISIACWILIDAFTGGEQYPLSHGNWDNRYKISISDNRFRFTLNNSNSVKDLDSETAPVPGQWHYLVTAYDGEDMEIWIDGKLDAFASFTGLISQTLYDLTFGQHLPGENGYNFMGSLDAVSIFDYALSAEQILYHMENSMDITTLPEPAGLRKKMNIFPNPVSGGVLNLTYYSSLPEDITVTLYDLSGQQITSKISCQTVPAESEITIPVGELENGVYVLSVTSLDQTEKELFIISR